MKIEEKILDELEYLHSVSEKNNQMLYWICKYLSSNDNDVKDFTMNYIANIISNRHER